MNIEPGQTPKDLGVLQAGPLTLVSGQGKAYIRQLASSNQSTTNA